MLRAGGMPKLLLAVLMTAPTPAKTRRHALAQWMVVCAAMLVLSGCGGNGGYSSSPPAPQPVPAVAPADSAPAETARAAAAAATEASFRREKLAFENEEYAPKYWDWDFDLGVRPGMLTAEFLARLEHCHYNTPSCGKLERRADNHLQLINASSAYARGATGKGETVYVTDDGIENFSSEFDALDESGARTGSKITTVTTQSVKVELQKVIKTPEGEFEWKKKYIRVPYAPGMYYVLDPEAFKEYLDKYSLSAVGEDDYIVLDHDAIGKDWWFSDGNYIYFSEDGHGTAVASLIAARRDGRTAGDNRTDLMRESPGDFKAVGDDRTKSNMHGVAYDANLHFHQVVFGKYAPDLPRNFSDWTQYHDKLIARQYFDLDRVRASGAAIVNHSFTWNVGNADTHDGKFVRENFRHTAAAIAQQGVPDAEKIIVVRAAGNNAGKVGYEDPTSPELHSSLGVHFPELRSHVLAVVAVDRNGDSAKFSNPCGSAKDFCIAAPGTDMVVLDGSIATYYRKSKRTPYYRVQDGTSFAAPLVSGGLALMRQYFSVDHADGTRSYQLGNTELVARLLATANKTGKYADTHKYGQGLMDLDAATAPVGALATSLSTDPNAQPFDASAFAVSGNAFGGAMRDALGGV
ncbi:MAG: S8 family serine peptidase, partial [Gammaproteobacteria bacterium]|nr:S8 family serine peptidase [Gammaproteobacteria bacterium]